MSRTLHICLKAGEKIYLNGAVLRADRKVILELLNEATFLLENHVLQVEQTTTPLRQLYFIVQSMLMDPTGADAARNLCFRHLASLSLAYSNPDMLACLDGLKELLADDRCFEALRVLRGLFELEDATMGNDAVVPPKVA